MGRRSIRRGRMGVAWCARLLAALVAPSVAQAQGQGKRVMLYTGTTGFRHTDGINNGRPVIQSKLEALGYTVDWEDCNQPRHRGTTNCNHADKNPRIFTDANLARYDAIVMLNMSWKFAGGNLPGPLLEDAAEGRDHQVHAERRRHRGGPQRDRRRRRAVDLGLVGRRQPNSVVGIDDARPRRDERHRQHRDRAGRPTRTTCRPRTSRTRGRSWTSTTTSCATSAATTTCSRRSTSARTPRAPTPSGQDHPITWCKLYDGANIDDGTPTRQGRTRDGRTWITGMGHFGVSLHRERRRQQPGQDDRRRHPLGRGRGQEDRLLGHRVVELPPHGPGGRREPADRHRRGEGRQGLLVRDGPARHRRQPVQLAGLRS